MRLSVLTRLTPLIVFIMLGCAATTGRIVKDEGDKGWIIVDRMYLPYPPAINVAREFCRQRGLEFTRDIASIRSDFVARLNLGFEAADGRTFNFKCDPKPQLTPLTPQPVQLQPQETDRLRAEAEASRQRQRQLEEQLNQARQPPAPSQPVVTPNTDRLSLDASKVKCTDLGFKPGTEAHGKCVLQLSK